jgi:hypothetical protein
MCKQDAYNFLRLKYETDVKNTSVRVFFDKNLKFCNEHGITLTSLTQQIARKKWGKGQNLDFKIQECQNKIVKEKEKELNILADQTIDRNQRHLRLWDKFLDKIEKAIDSKFKIGLNLETGQVDYVSFDPRDLKAISSSLSDAQKGHRLGEGLDKADEVEAEKSPAINTIANLNDGLI